MALNSPHPMGADQQRAQFAAFVASCMHAQIETDQDSPVVESHRVALAAVTRSLPFSSKLSLQARRRWGGLGEQARFARLRLFGMTKAIREPYIAHSQAFPALHAAAECALATPSWHAELKMTANGMVYGSYMHHADEGLGRVEDAVGQAADTVSWAAKACGLPALHPASWWPYISGNKQGGNDVEEGSSFDQLGARVLRGDDAGSRGSGSGSAGWRGSSGIDALRVGGEIMVSDLSFFGRSKTKMKAGTLEFTQFPVRRRGPSIFPGISYSAAMCADVSSWFEGKLGSGSESSWDTGRSDQVGGKVRATSPGGKDDDSGSESRSPFSTYEPEEETSLAALSEGGGRATHLLTASVEQIRMGQPTMKLMYRHALHGGQAALRSGEAGPRSGDTPETLSQIEWDYSKNQPLVSAGIYLPFRTTGSLIRGSVTSQGVVRGEVERTLVPGARAALLFDGGLWPADKFKLQCRVKIGEGYEREQQEVTAVTPLLLKDGPTALWE